jgi:hypothetical protein
VVSSSGKGGASDGDSRVLVWGCLPDTSNMCIVCSRDGPLIRLMGGVNRPHPLCLSAPQQEQPRIVVGVSLTCSGRQLGACHGCRGGKSIAYRCSDSMSGSADRAQQQESRGISSLAKGMHGRY